MAAKTPELLTSEQRDRFGRIPEDLTEIEIARHYTLTRADKAFIYQHNRENWLGVGVQIAVLHYPGMALRDLPALPFPVVSYVAEQIGCDPTEMEGYAAGINTANIHLDEICERFGYTKWDSVFTRPICQALVNEALHQDQPLAMMEATMAYFRAEKMLIPAISTVEQIAWLTLRFAERFSYHHLVSFLSAEQCQRLDQMVERTTTIKGARTRLSWLRQQAKKPSPRSLNHLTERIEWLNTLALPPLPDSDTIPLSRMRTLARRTARYRAQPLAHFPPTKRHALLYCYLAHLRRDLIDQSVEMVGRMDSELWRKGEEQQDAHLKQHSRASNQNLITLTDVAAAVLVAFMDNLDVFDLVFSIAGPETLQDLIETNDQIVRPPDLNVFDLVQIRYGNLRNAWLRWFSALRFTPSSGQHAGLQSLTHVLRLRQHKQRVTEVVQRLKRRQVVQAPLSHFIDNDRWRKLILQEGVIQPDFYEMCGFETVYNDVMSGQIAIEGSYRYQAFSAYLLPYPRWLELKNSGQTRLPITGTWHAYRDARLPVMQAAVDAVDEALSRSDSGLTRGADGQFHLERPESGVPAAAKPLQASVERYLPQADLPDVMLDVDAWTDFLSDFRHLETGEVPVGRDRLILIAVLMALGMNLSFHRMAMASPFTFKELMAVRTWYVREETLQAAQTRLDLFMLRQPIARLWGRGTAVSSDGMRFPVAANVAYSQHNPRIPARKRGLSLYSHTLDIWGILGQQLIPPSEREALYALDMLENHPPEFNILEHYSDTHGFTHHVFALSTLLGYYFAPRLRDLLDQRLYALPGLKIPDSLKGMFSGRANIKVVEHMWDDMLWSTCSIRHGTVSPSLLMRKLRAYPRRSQLSKALFEFGKIEKTIFILTYFVDEQLERRIESGKNKGESVQGMARATFNGQRGELRTTAFQEQFHRTSALMFLVTLMCAWNTVYLHQIREYFAAIGAVTDEELWQHISPARWKHFNMLGHYTFDEELDRSLNNLRPILLNAPDPEEEMD